MRRRVTMAAVLVGLTLGVAFVPSVARVAGAAAPPDTRLGEVTGTGVHNTYDKAMFGSLTAALDAAAAGGDLGPKLIELDVWTLWRRWLVAHDLPFLPGSNNNCTRGTARDQDLGGCLDNLRSWHDAHPGHAPVVVKIEMKNGFAASSGFGPTQFDALIRGRLGDAALYRPADLLTRPDGSRFADLDAAAAANNWATLAAVRGRFLVLVQTGTFEENNPLDTLHTDVEYGGYLRGAATTAVAFPVVKRSGATADPRTRYAADLRPWFVSVDTDAAGFVALPASTRSWYAGQHLWVVATDVHAVPPPLDQRAPTTAAAVARVQLIACAQASVASSDWAQVPGWQVSFPRGSC
jgi:hypothetical protein